MTGLGLDPALLLQVCAHAQRISGNDPNRWIARLVESEAAATLPTEIIDIVTAIASTDPDPEDDVWLPSQPGATAFYGGDIDLAGLNCARGAAALALGTLVRENRTRLTATRDALTRVAVDPTLQVRAMAAAAFTSILDIDAHLALDLFRSAVTDATDELLASSHVERFLHYAVRTKHYTQLADILDRMANSPIDEVRQAGARQLTVASFADPTLDPRVDTALSADDATRLGVVGVFAANVIEPNRRERIFEVLTQSFADSSNQVRSRAARAFYGMDKQRLGDYTALLEAFAQSPSVGDNAGAALHLLDESRHPLPTAALDICERFVQIHGASIADISTSAAADARPIVQLVLRLHAQTKDADIRRRCLDMIDQLVTLGAYGIDDDLAAIER